MGHNWRQVTSHKIISFTDTLICVTYLSSFVKARPIIASDVEISIILYYIILNVVVQTDTSKYHSLTGITNSTFNFQSQFLSNAKN